MEKMCINGVSGQNKEGNVGTFTLNWKHGVDGNVLHFVGFLFYHH
jgi:hypothetical protein